MPRTSRNRKRSLDDSDNSEKINVKSKHKSEEKPKRKTKAAIKKQNKHTDSNGHQDQTSDLEMKNKFILQLENVVQAKVINRPSKVVKSPYMADIVVQGDTKEVLCHSPALGCAGIITPGTNAIVTPKIAAKSDAKSKYSLDLVDVGPSIVGVNPMMCNKMVKKALELGLVEGLPKFDKSEIKAEVTVGESRFDFRCIQGDITYYVEVKGVPCACIEDVPLTVKKKEAMMETINKAKNKIAYFPDGYRKSNEEVISPRALKHVQHLTRLADEDKTICMLLFVVQRSDCRIFQPTHNDPVYREAVYQASKAGVKIVAHTVLWSEQGNATWSKTLPMNLHDDNDQFEA